MVTRHFIIEILRYLQHFGILRFVHVLHKLLDKFRVLPLEVDYLPKLAFIMVQMPQNFVKPILCLDG